LEKADACQNAGIAVNCSAVNNIINLKENTVFNYYTLLMGQPSGDAGPSLMSNIILFGSIIAIFYFMIIRPQQKRAKERQKLIDSMKKGDKVVTSGGMYGTIAGLDDKTVLVQIADNVKVKLDRGSIATIISESVPEIK
jgi:preprotein translocase subunit YajC